MPTPSASPPPAPEETTGQLPFSSGLVPGLWGALAMLALLLLEGVTRIDGPLYFLYHVASTFLGPHAMLGGVGPFFVGLAVHLAMGAGLGALFAVLVGRVRRRRAVFAGAGFGGLVGLIMLFAVLPLTSPYMAERLEGGLFLFAHLLYGTVLGATLPARAASPASPPAPVLTPWRRPARP